MKLVVSRDGQQADDADENKIVNCTKLILSFIIDVMEYNDNDDVDELIVMNVMKHELLWNCQNKNHNNTKLVLGLFDILRT